MPRPGLPLCALQRLLLRQHRRAALHHPQGPPSRRRSCGARAGGPTWRGCGCSLRSRKNDPRRRRISRIGRRTHRSSPNASPPSDRTRLSRVVAPRGPRVRIPLAPAARQSANHRFRRRFYGESDRPGCVGNPELSCRGTRSSNPSPSSAESPANLTPLLEGRFAGRAPATRLAARSRVLAPSRRR